MRLNEDNTSGLHTSTVTTGIDRSVTGGNDAPLPVGNGRLRQAAKQAKDTLMGTDSTTTINRGTVSIKGGDTTINQTLNQTIKVDQRTSIGDGLAWFGQHFKEFAIVAAASAAVMAIAKLIKKADKSIKFRYNKVVKSLQKAQKDFTLEKGGMNMSAVLPGIGSRLNDWITRVFSGNWKAKKHMRGNIGLHPFCQNYIDEISADYATATAAFSKIKLGSEKADADRNTDSSVGGAQHQNVSTSAYSGKIYSSFKELCRENLINEGMSPDKIDESVTLAAITAGVSLASLGAKAGTFLYQRFKNGKPSGKPQQVKVTAESTREICYAIINNYADKYVNTKQVFKELGIDSESLADIDKSSVDKLRTVLEKYQKPEKNTYTKQYTRINEAYKKMLGHYYRIGDGIIDNFVKYTEAKDEKHSNLLVASKEKLKNMWDSQKEFYDNNFSHVLIEIVASEPYIQYLDFIIKKVLPVFKSGLAGDADYILDVVPKESEYYIIRQTGDQEVTVKGDEIKGKVAIAKVEGFDQKSKKIKFNIIGALENGKYTVGEDGVATIDSEGESKVDFNVYKDKGEIELEYGKWLSLDPIQLYWSPEKTSNTYVFENENSSTYIFAKVPYSEAENGYNKIYVVSTSKNTPRDVIGAHIIKYNGKLLDEDFDLMCEKMGCESWQPDINLINYYTEQADKSENEEQTEDIDSTIDTIKKYIGEYKAPTVHAVSKLYERDTENKSGRKIKEYVYAVIEESDESFKSCGKEILNEDDTDEKDSDTNDDTNNDTNNDTNDNQNKDEQEDQQKLFNVIEPGSEAASKDVVKMLICGNIDISSNKSIMDDPKENKFDGSIINIDPACSIDDIDKKLESLNFKTVDEGANKIKSRLLQLVMSQSGNVRKSNVGNFNIDKLEDALVVIENRENAYEKMTSNLPKISEDILSKVQSILKDSPDKMFDLFKFTSPNNPNEIIHLKDQTHKIYLLKKEYIDHQYIEYDTNIKYDNIDKTIILYLYPTIIKENPKVQKKDVFSGKNRGYGILIYLNRDIYDIVPLNKDEIEGSLKKIFDALVKGGTIEQSRFVLAGDENIDKSATGSENNNNNNTNQQKPEENNNNNNTDQQNPAENTQDKSTDTTTGTTGESINIMYRCDYSLSESTNTSTVKIRRKISGRFKNWYVVSEAVYDDGSGYKSKLDNRRVVESMNDRADFSRFSKSSRLAKFLPFESQQDYTLMSDKGYVPSISTPLYESVVLVKFDKNDKVSDRVFAGKRKIN